VAWLAINCYHASSRSIDSLGPKSIFLVGKLKLDLYELFAWNALGARDIKKYFVFYH
jgi:hypothetical protein